MSGFSAKGAQTERSSTKRFANACVRALPIEQWPEADREAWQKACRPRLRLKRGGALSHLATAVIKDLASRYSYFLQFLSSAGRLDPHAQAGAQVTPENVELYLDRLQKRLRSVTVYGSIYKLRRAAQAIAPERDFSWLSEIEKDLALLMQPRSKYGRLVLSEILVAAGLALMTEAETTPNVSRLARYRQFRNGLMIALLAACPIRLKNFAALRVERSFVQIKSSWWIVLAASETKEKRADERPVPSVLISWIDRYLNDYRPVLARTEKTINALWLSSTEGSPLTYSAVERIISQTTLATVGVNVSPHLFRTAAASSIAIHAGAKPYLACALLHHTHPAVTQEHYNRASSMSAAQAYAAIAGRFRQFD